MAFAVASPASQQWLTQPATALSLIAGSAAAFVQTLKRLPRSVVHTTRRVLAVLTLCLAAVGFFSNSELAHTKWLTALCLSLLAAALFRIDARSPRLTERTALAVILLSALPLFTLAYGAASGGPSFAPHTMSLGAALSLGLLARATLSCRPDGDILQLWRHPSFAGRAFRWALPAAVVLPVLVSLLRQHLVRIGTIEPTAAAAWGTVINIGILSTVTLWGGTALRRNFAELQQSRKFLDAIIENIPHMVFVKDAERLSFVRFNKAGEQLLGLKRDQMLGKTDFDFFPPDEAKFFQDQDRKTLESRQLVVIAEEPIATASGERWLRTKKVPVLDPEGEAAFLLGISEDITEVRRSGLELRAAKDAAEANAKELESFSYSVSHDLRAPLRSIDGFSQALEEDLKPVLNDRTRQYLSRVRANAQHMAHLIDDLLRLSRVTRAALSRADVDLSSLAEEIRAELVATDPNRNVRWSIQPGLHSHADQGLLKVLLDNLLNNAWKFTSKKPQAHIEFGQTTDDHGNPCFFVRDDGAGFDMSYADKLFGAFQRLHAASEFEGTGVGLATVSRVALRHGGRIWAKAAQGQGATFFFTLS